MHDSHFRKILLEKVIRVAFQSLGIRVGSNQLMTSQTFTGLDIIIDGEDSNRSVVQNSNVAKDEKMLPGYKKEIIIIARMPADTIFR